MPLSATCYADAAYATLPYAYYYADALMLDAAIPLFYCCCFRAPAIRLICQRAICCYHTPCCYGCHIEAAAAALRALLMMLRRLLALITLRAIIFAAEAPAAIFSRDAATFRRSHYAMLPPGDKMP